MLFFSELEIYHDIEANNHQVVQKSDRNTTDQSYTSARSRLWRLVADSAQETRKKASLVEEIHLHLLVLRMEAARRTEKTRLKNAVDSLRGEREEKGPRRPILSFAVVRTLCYNRSRYSPSKYCSKLPVGDHKIELGGQKCVVVANRGKSVPPSPTRPVPE